MVSYYRPSENIKNFWNYKKKHVTNQIYIDKNLSRQYNNFYIFCMLNVIFEHYFFKYKNYNIIMTIYNNNNIIIQ